MISQISTAISQPIIVGRKENEVKLPDELWLKVFSHLAPWDLGKISSVCIQWHRCTGERKFWEIFKKNIDSKSRMLKARSVEFYRLCDKERCDKEIKDVSQLKKIVYEYYNEQIKNNLFKEYLKAHLLDFNEDRKEFFSDYAKKHREKVILYPEFLLSLRGVEAKSLKFKAMDFLNLYIDLNEEELIFRWSILLRHMDDFDIIDGEILIKCGIKDILERVLEKGAYTLLAANLHKCYYLKFKDKYQLIKSILNRIKELSWIQQYRIVNTLKTNFPLDINISKKEYDEISELLVVEEWATEENLLGIKDSEKDSESFKVAAYALSFFKTSCLLICGLATCALLASFTLPCYTPLLLKVVAASGLCFIGMWSVSKVIERYLTPDINGLILKALNDVETSSSSSIWRQKLKDRGFLTPLIYKSCQQANIPYKQLDNHQNSADVFSVFYAIHFAIDRFAVEFQCAEKDKKNLIKMIKFLEEWRVELHNQIFIKRDNFYKNPTFFSQKYRQDVANHRTKEALQTYQIKKNARKIGVEFPAVTSNICDHKEKIEAMANEIQGCASITEWLHKLEEKNLLTDLLQLAQFNLPPNYRCVSTGRLLTSAVSIQGNFFNVEIANEKLKTLNTIHNRNYEYEVETSSDIMWALITVFLEYFHRNKFVKEESSTNIKINDCLRFLYDHFFKEIKKIESLNPFLEEDEMKKMKNFYSQWKAFFSYWMANEKKKNFFNDYRSYFNIDFRVPIYGRKFDE